MKFIKTLGDEFKKYRKYMIYAAKSQLKSEVANSYLNWLWWIIEPLCMMVIYSLIFGKLFNMSEPYFNIFIFLGLAIWDFFNRCAKSAVKLVKRNKSIVSKVYIPKYILLISEMIVNMFKMGICLGITFLMMLIYRVPLTLNILYAIPIIIVSITFTFGICVFLMHFGVFIEDLANIINIVLKFAFYFTGIFYSIQTRFPSPYKEFLLNFYPLATFIEMLRDCTLYGKGINIILLVILFIISIIISLLGIKCVKKNENTYVKVI
jgi:ABC-type polysaccharide/polyol phosphate export permease